MPAHPRTRVYYHGKCPDGFAAAFAAWLKLGDDAEYVPCVYFNDLPAETSFEGVDVYILDYSFPLEVMERISREARSLVLLDHHATAEKSLGRFKPVCCGKIHFDMDSSGAVLSWKHFFPDRPVPYLFQCIESRDLWRFDVPGDKAYLSWLDVQPQDFRVWLSALLSTEEEVERCKVLGQAMREKFDSLCASIAEAAVPVHVAGFDGLAVNASVEFVSEVGGLLAERSGTFGLVWRVLPDKRVKCSMRSQAPFDTSAIAAQFYGGGHKYAASFVLPTNRLMHLVNGKLEPIHG